MRFKPPTRVLGLAFLCTVLLSTQGRAEGHQRLIILAIDQSGSMKQSDPERLRVEAASMLVSLAADDDRIGLIGFGNSAQWLVEPVEKSKFDLARIASVKDSEAYTSFSSVFALWSDYLSHQEASYFQTHDSSLLLFTDGQSDPPDHNSARDRTESFNAVSAINGRGRVFIVGLGKDLDGTFLDELANRSGGARSDATSATELPDAFLRVATKILALPVYDRRSNPGTFHWEGKPERVFAVFIGASADSLRADGNTLYSGRHIAVQSAKPSADELSASWSGDGSAFLCIHQPLRIEPARSLPVSLLTDGSEEAQLHVADPTGPLAHPFFLRESPGNAVSADLVFEQPAHSELIPATPTPDGGFQARLALQQGGQYRVVARLHSTYGSIETYLGDTTVRNVPVTLPDQQVVAVFDPLPRLLFAPRLSLRSELPTGIVRLSFSSSQEATVEPLQLTLSPGQPQTITISESGAANTVQTLDYTAIWDDGSATAQRKGTLRILVKQMSLVEFMRAKWPWIAGTVVVLLVLFRLISILRPLPIRGSLVVLSDGIQVGRLDLPQQGKRTSIKIRESSSIAGLSGRTFSVRGDRDRDLLELRSARRGTRWHVYATPHEARLYDVRGPARAAQPLRELRNPHFKTEDGRILIRFLP